MEAKSLLVRFGTDTKAMEAGFRKADKYVESHAAKFKKAGMAMTIAGGAIIGIVGGLVKSYADFDDKLTKSTAIMGDVSDAMRTKMAEAAKEMSEKSTFAAAELAEAYYFLASAGMDAEQSIAALPAVTAFATAGAFDLAKATDLLTDAQSALGLSSDDVVKNQENMVMVSDQLVMANTLANASVSQFSEALTNKAGAAMRAYNIDTTEGIAVLAAFADQGVKGKQAGEKYSIVLRDLQKATQENSAAFERAGVAVYDANGNLNNMGDIIGQLEARFASMSPEQKKAELGMMGFQEESQGVLLTLMGTSEKIKEYEKNLKKAGGTTETVARKQMQSLTSQLAMAKNTIMNTAISIGEQLAPMITELAETISKTVKKISAWIKEHPDLVKWIATTALKVGVLLAVLGPVLIMLPKIAAGLKLVKAAFIALQSPVGLIGIGILALVVAFKDMMKTMDDAKKAMADFADESTIFMDAAENFKALWVTVRQEGGTTLELFNELMTRFGGNWESIMKTIVKDPKFATLKVLLLDIASGVREVDLAGQDLAITLPGSFITAGKGAEEIVKAIFAANEEIVGITKTLNDDLKKCYESDYQTAKRHLEEKLADTIAAIQAVKAAAGAGADELAQLDAEKNGAIAAARATFRAEDAALDKDHKEAEATRLKTAVQKYIDGYKTYYDDLEEKRKANAAKAKAADEKHRGEKAELIDSIKQLEMGQWEYANWALDERLKKEETTTTNLKLLWEEYNAQKSALAKAQEEEEAALRKQAIENTLANISNILSMIGSLFQQSFDNKMMLIDQEEERRLESIDLQYNAAIEAAEALLEAETAKTEELMRLEQEKTDAVLAAINNEYDEKKKWIEKHVIDEEQKQKMLAKLEVKREKALAKAAKKRAKEEEKARRDRVKAEGDAAKALEELEEAKNEALRIASEELEIKRSAARKTAAKQEKAVALLSAIVNTAAAVAKALPNVPLAIAVGILGAIQIAIIKAQPLPLKEGGVIMKRTVVEAGEAGPEAFIPLNKLGGLGGLLQPAPVSVKITLINYGDINNVGDLDEISERLARRLTRQLERGRA